MLDLAGTQIVGFLKHRLIYEPHQQNMVSGFIIISITNQAEELRTSPCLHLRSRIYVLYNSFSSRTAVEIHGNICFRKKKHASSKVIVIYLVSCHMKCL